VAPVMFDPSTGLKVLPAGIVDEVLSQGLDPAPRQGRANAVSTLKLPKKWTKKGD